MKYPRLALVVVALLAISACKRSRRDECENLRDLNLRVQEKATVDALAAYDGSNKAELESQSKKELEQFKANFADACVAQETLDLGCLTHQNKPECKQPLETLWKAVYK